MALILNIDTATDCASIALSHKLDVLASNKNEEIRDHAAWLHNAIHQMMVHSAFSLSQLEAIAVTAGPGSYTGLRVGMAAAKGLCYVLGIPLITENTLKIMANAAIKQLTHSITQRDNHNRETLILETLFVPMIDARRMEVFTAAYDHELREMMPPVALVLDAASFDGVKGDRLVCFGNGSHKFESIAQPGRFQFIDIKPDATSLSQLAYQKFLKGDFADLAYAEPFYLKEFYSPAKK